ncbi:MAG TPA: hypothetical protein VFI02_03250, partial [Armatimonadota bacterium]|nr:hypothetical protein [Armatimonadota bacterium]
MSDITLEDLGFDEPKAPTEEEILAENGITLGDLGFDEPQTEQKPPETPPSPASEPYFGIKIPPEADELAALVPGGERLLEEAAGDIYLADLLNIPAGDAGTLLDPIRKEDPNWKKGLQQIEQSWQSGWIDAQIGMLRWNQLTRYLQRRKPEEAQQQIQAIEEQVAALRGQQPEVDPTKMGFFWRTLSSTARILPNMLKGLERGAQLGGASALAAGGMAALLGQAGPQIGLPEEAITVPVAAGMGFALGTATGVAQYSTQVEGGMALDEMLQEGIDPNIAAAASLGVGVINGLIETSVVGDLAKTIPGVKDLIAKASRMATKEVVKSGILKSLARSAMAAGKHTLIETGQEVAQRGVYITFDEFSKHFTNLMNEARTHPPGGLASTYAKLTPRKIGEILRDLKDEAVQSALAFAPLQIPGMLARTVVGTGRAAQATPATGEAPVAKAPAPAGEAISQARALLSRPEELTQERATEAETQLDAILQSPEATPEEVVEAALTANALEQEMELLTRAVAPEEMGALEPEQVARAATGNKVMGAEGPAPASVVEEVPASGIFNPEPPNCGDTNISSSPSKRRNILRYLSAYPCAIGRKSGTVFGRGGRWRLDRGRGIPSRK